MYLSVDLFEHNDEFHLNKEFDAVYGSNLGGATVNCTAHTPNTLFCEIQHTEKPDWHFSTTNEFYNIGNVVTTRVPYKDDLTVKKYYERLIKEGDVGNRPEERRVFRQEGNYTINM